LTTLEKVLVIGANGLLGTKLIYCLLSEKYNQNYGPVAADIQNNLIPKNVEFKNIDITNKENTINSITQINPDGAILSAAFTNVDKNEDERELAHNINSIGPENVALGCIKADSKLIHMSTDFIFDGTIGNYSEDDDPNPLSYYGKTKLEGEQRVIATGVEYLICRTSVLYGWYPARLNFITWVLKSLEDGNEINITTDQINSPTFANNLAEVLLHLIEYNKSDIIHTVGDCILNRYEIAIKCAEVFNLPQKLIKPIESFKQKAIRPKKGSLNISKLKKILGDRLKVFSLDEGLKFMREHRNL